VSRPNLTHPEVVADLAQPNGHAMDMPSSVHRGDRDSAAFLYVGGGQAKLDWHWDDCADPHCGSASRGSV
jgi:hypothetical protein